MVSCTIFDVNIDIVAQIGSHIFCVSGQRGEPDQKQLNKDILISRDLFFVLVHAVFVASKM